MKGYEKNMEKIKSVDLLNFKEQLEHFMIYEIERNPNSHRGCKDFDDTWTTESACQTVLYKVNSLINEIDKKASEENYE